MVKTENVIGVDARLLSRVLTEGYGPGAWHGADIKAAIAEVPPELVQLNKRVVHRQMDVSGLIGKSA